MLDNLHVGMSLAGEGSLREDGCTFIQRHSRYTSIFMTTTPRYMKDKTVKELQIVCQYIYIYMSYRLIEYPYTRQFRHCHPFVQLFEIS